MDNKRKEDLDKVNEKEHYFGSDFGKIANNILQKGHSLVVMTDNCYESNVKPWTYDFNRVQRTNISVSGTFCFLIRYQFLILSL